MSSKASPRNKASRAPALPGRALTDAVALHRADRLDAAEQAYATIRKRDPDYPEAQRLRAVIAQQRGQSDVAIRLLRRALEQQPANPVYHHTLAEILRAAGDTSAAIESYRRAWRLAPDRPASGIDLGDAQRRAGHAEAALATYRAVLSASPDYVDAHERLTTLLYERGAPDAARAQLADWQAAIGTDRRARHRLAVCHATIGDFATAAVLYRQLHAEDATDATACAGLGSVLQSQGQFMEAREWLEAALDLKPEIGWIYAALLSDRSYAMSAAREAMMREQIASPRTSERSRIDLNFALGQLLDRRAEYPQAFEYFAAGNRLHARLMPFDRDVFDDRIDRIIRVFSPALFARRATTGLATEKPVFVVGMPRSGTSLVEQIVASHPQAFGAGEMDDIRRLVRELPTLVDTGGGARARFPECVDALGDKAIQALAMRYLAALDQRAPEAARVTDKMPFNMLWLGLIALLFPGARIVYCRREPMDNGLSCYVQLFSQGLRFAYDLGDIGHVYRQHERLMAHWARTLPLDMLTVDYEALVADPEAQTRRLIDFVGLEWDARCLAPHRTERDVRTASVWQVRQPVYRSSVERWRAYEPWLGPLAEALGERGQD